MLKRVVSFLALFLLFNPSVYAGPQGGSFSNGTGGVAGDGTANVVVTQTSETAVMHWNNFDLNAGDEIQFIQPSGTSVTLNRLLSTDHPVLRGNIVSNGHVALINQDNILFNPSGRLDTTALSLDHVVMPTQYTDVLISSDIAYTPTSVLSAQRPTIYDESMQGFVSPASYPYNIVFAGIEKAVPEAGEGMAVDLYGDRLMLFKLPDETSKGLSTAPKRIMLSPTDARRVLNGAVYVKGKQEAHKAVKKNRKVYLSR